MTYAATCDYLFSQLPMFERQGASGYKEGLANSLALDAHFGHPHRAYPTIHIAGTNGKGSCAHTIAALLQSAGYRVGLYTSPHIVDFRERIRVNGEPVSEQYVVDFVERERGFFEPLCPTFFELTTAMAFLYFKEQKVDYAVVEVGLGGRLDCTNIITPILSIITNISLDHTQFLGDTRAKIAAEKAGIMKRGVYTIVGEADEETRPVFAAKAKEVGAMLEFADDHNQIIAATHNAEIGGIDYATCHFGSFHGQLGGDYQVRNTNTILNALAYLQAIELDNFPDTGYAFAHVADMTGLLGRWQILGREPLTVCDAGHNLGGWHYLAGQIARVPCKRRHIVFGMVDDKDIDHVMDLLPKDAEYYFTRPSSHRALPETIVAQKGEERGLHGHAYATVAGAYSAAKAAAAPDDFIFIGGSCYVVSDLLADA